jgi:hypothetical protein
MGVERWNKIHFMEDITAVYRMNIGVSSTFMKKNSVYKKVLIDIFTTVQG